MIVYLGEIRGVQFLSFFFFNVYQLCNRENELSYTMNGSDCQNLGYPNGLAACSSV